MKTEQLKANTNMQMRVTMSQDNETNLPGGSPDERSETANAISEKLRAEERFQ